MSDTVKLIIEIPSIDYEYLKNNCIIPIKYDNHIYEAILSGIPLDDVKAEFKDLYPKNYAGEPEFGGRFCQFSLCKVFEILDNIGKAESEDKE